MTPIRVLVVEDDTVVRLSVAEELRDAGFEVDAVATAETALERLSSPALRPDLLVLDVRLPGMSGVELVRQATEGGLPPTVVMSGEATLGEAVEAVRLGVVDFLEKPVRRERLLHSLRTALELTGLRRRVESLEGRAAAERRLVGESPPMRRLREQIERVAATDVSVLVLGESGTGKELVAEAIHAASPRQRGPLVRLNCAAIPATMIEDELFGHVRGAFTGAESARAGLFEAADRGTLFLDEIGDMAAELQTRLLRILEDGKLRRIGGNEERRVDVRVVAATHRSLDGSALFRQDLYYRLAQVPLLVPPLRQRIEDLPALAEHLLSRICDRHQRPRPRFDPAVWRALEADPWPGNVRELAALLERLVILGGDSITLTDLPASVGRRPSLPASPADEWPSLREWRRQCERGYLDGLLRATDWNVAEAARRAGIERSHLHGKLRRLGLRRPTSP